MDKFKIRLFLESKGIDLKNLKKHTFDEIAAIRNELFEEKLICKEIESYLKNTKTGYYKINGVNRGIFVNEVV